MDAALVSDWNHAAEIDKSLLPSRDSLKALAELELRPESYSRRKLFSAMAREEPILFRDFPVRRTLRAFFRDGVDPASRLKTLFRSSTKTLARTGPAKRVRYLRVHEVIDRWRRGRATISANDVYFRESKLDRAFDCEAIGDFNVLPTAPPRIRHLEVATLLMGTAGCMTDSHADDPDGCNHCVVGKKLWLVWDRLEGQQSGLEDCEYNEVHTQAKFSLEAFVTLRSAKWFTMSEGRTLFLPGNLTHKVITLERYLGISSFYVGLPNALSSVTRWRLNGTIMITERWRNEIIKLILERLARTAAGSRRVKQKWGFYHLGEALWHWERKYTRAQREELLFDPHFRELADAVSRAAANASSLSA